MPRPDDYGPDAVTADWEERLEAAMRRHEIEDALGEDAADELRATLVDIVRTQVPQ